MNKAIFRVLPGFLLLGVSFLLPAPARAEFDDTFDRTVPLQAGGSFEIQNVNGSVEVSGWDRNEVEIHAVKSAKRRTQDLNRVSIEVSGGPDAVSIVTRYPHDEGVAVTVEYRIHVPRNAQVRRVATVNGGVHVTGINHAGELRTVNGTIELFGSAGQISAHTTNGNLHLELSRFDEQSSLELETVNGSVLIGLPSDAGGSLEVSTLNGSFRSDLPVTLEGNFSSRDFHGSLGRGGNPIRIRTVNGGIRVVATRPTV